MLYIVEAVEDNSSDDIMTEGARPVFLAESLDEAKNYCRVSSVPQDMYYFKGYNIYEASTTNVPEKVLQWRDFTKEFVTHKDYLSIDLSLNYDGPWW